MKGSLFERDSAAEDEAYQDMSSLSRSLSEPDSVPCSSQANIASKLAVYFEMGSKIRKIFLAFTCTFLLALLVCVPNGALIAQEKQSLSVTPPFNQLVVKPGDTFKSLIKVVNVNSFPLTVYATPVNFETADEGGHPKFIPLLNDPIDKTTFAGWIEVAREPITVAPESTASVEYSISVPDNAPPGGHFAAILIGTRPPIDETQNQPASVQTSQVVSSLFLARVAGEVKEGGQIREFSVAKSFSSTPKAEFILRFENTGNVYVQPQGDITIYNMWGTERGFIPVNHKTNFGNVLPKSIRKFSFTWEGTPSITDIGRYKAVATIAYGIDAKQSVDRTVYFWVIPVRATLITLGFIAGFILFVMFAVRLYIRSMLRLAGVDPRLVQTTKAVRRAKITRKEMVAPIREGVLDLRRSVVRSAVKEEKVKGLSYFIRDYRTFFLSTIIGILGVGLIVWYIVDARGTERPYEVTMKQTDGDVTITSEEVLRDRERIEAANEEQNEEAEGAETLGSKEYVSVVNASGKVGAGATVALRLEKAGFMVRDISTDTDERTASVIVYNHDKLEIAKKLSELLGGVALSARIEGEETEPEVLIIIGNDATE